MKTPITDQVRYDCNDKAQLSGWCFRSAYESMTEHAEQFERGLAVERALADRLAHRLELSLAGWDSALWTAPMDAAEVEESDEALAAYKQARNPAQTTTEGAE